MNFDWKSWNLDWKVLIFDEGAIFRLQERGSLVAGILLLILAILLQALVLEGFAFAFLWALVRFFGGVLVVYLLIKILTSELDFSFEKFIFGVSLACVLGLVFAWVLTGLSYLILDGGLGISSVTNLLLEYRKYYLILLFGFSSDVLSGLKGWKSIVVGMGAVTVLWVLSLLVQ